MANNRCDNIVNNFAALSKKHKFDSDYLNFCLGYLCDYFGNSKQYVICELIKAGLSSHKIYAASKEEMDAAWAEALKTAKASGK